MSLQHGQPAVPQKFSLIGNSLLTDARTDALFRWLTTIHCALRLHTHTRRLVATCYFRGIIKSAKDTQNHFRPQNKQESPAVADKHERRGVM